MNVITVICTLFGFVFFIGGFGAATGAPQQAAAAAVGVACAVLPYVLYKVGYCQKSKNNQKEIIALLKKIENNTRISPPNDNELKQ